MITVNLSIKTLSISSGIHCVEGKKSIPAVSLEVTHDNRRISIGMTAEEARAMAELMCKQADRADAVARSETMLGQSVEN